MNFLEAKRVLDAFTGSQPLHFLFGLSGSAEPFDIYLRAVAAKRGFAAQPRTLPFNTLAQTLRAGTASGSPEVLLLFPWDFVPEADWRTGAPDQIDGRAAREAALELEHLVSRRNAKVLYVRAPMPPLFANPDSDAALALAIESHAAALGARVLGPEFFSLPGYFASGCPVGGAHIGAVAEAVIDLVLRPPTQPKKVLVTDLDGVVWNGIIGEDGADGIAFDQNGRGYPHFIYQRVIRRLGREGTVLTAVSRNEAEVALAPFRSANMTLREEDFVAIVASYNAKSAQISELAARLNLGLDAFVFVDDNPVELSEVSLALPTVRCLQFPSKAEELPAFLSTLVALFPRLEITTEDRERTALYRRRVEGMVPSTVSGADITEFLRELGMTLTIHDRSTGDRKRAVQLINKTNQFNANGRRLSDEDVHAILESGGRLYGATLDDRTGTHGEILACLIDQNGVIRSFVMSCRVFQRHVEHAFLAWLTSQPDPPAAVAWEKTDRNEPFAAFLRDLAGAEPASNGIVTLPYESIRVRCAPHLKLFAVSFSEVAV